MVSMNHNDVGLPKVNEHLLTSCVTRSGGSGCTFMLSDILPFMAVIRHFTHFIRHFTHFLVPNHYYITRAIFYTVQTSVCQRETSNISMYSPLGAHHLQHAHEPSNIV